ncbi:MAG: hypothetical protein ACREQZ_00560, partial [Woeseiaceae bacterium]
LDLHKYVNPGLGEAQEKLIMLFERNRTRDYPIIVTLRAFNAADTRQWKDLPAGALKAQFAFFFGQRRISHNIGFYGWRLHPNRGIAQVDMLRLEFQELSSKGFASRRIGP